MMVGHTKFAPDQMFGQIAGNFYSLGVLNKENLSAVVGRHTIVIMGSG